MTVLHAFDTAVCFEREIIWYVRGIRQFHRDNHETDGRENRPFRKKRNRKIKNQKKKKKKKEEKSKQRLKSFGDLASVHEGISIA